MSHTQTGAIHKIFPTENKTESFQAREFILTLPDDKYPQYVKFQLVQDRCSLLDNYTEGQSITVHFDLRGREWVNAEGQAKYFTNLNAWRIEAAEGEQQGLTDVEAGMKLGEEGTPDDNDLPF